ncbi:MAG: Gfo/Idh/MocA family oxidoreductase [Anaerolineaceae bacterium]|nr:Gfo/Idh/MocA family oxidoreductase [Anaerolineaceae bacterium]
MKKDTQRLRVGVLGCGPIAQSAHFESCRKGRNTDLYAICDRAPDLLAGMQAIHRPQVVYQEYADMLADPHVDAVVVATADAFHVPLTLQALQAGKHVLVEKPLGLTVEECQQVAAEARARGLVLQVGHNKRFDPGVAYAGAFIRQEMGEVMALKSWYRDSCYRYQMTDNLQPEMWTSAQALHPEGNPKADRRRYLLLAHASHLLDTARFLCGEITAVQARLVEKFGAYCWLIAADFADGSGGQLDLTVDVRGDWQEGFQVLGENGSVLADLYMPWYFKTAKVECYSVKDGTRRGPIGGDGHSYRLQMEGFADTILHGVPQHGAGGEDGLACVRALVAVSRSVDSGQRVALADVTGGL